MMEIKKLFGLAYSGRLYTIRVPYREDRGRLGALSLSVAAYADFIIDLSDGVILKLRSVPEPETKSGDYVKGIMELFTFVPEINQDELVKTEPRLQGIPVY